MTRCRDCGATQPSTTCDVTGFACVFIPAPEIVGREQPAYLCQQCKKSVATENWGGTHDQVSLARNQSLIQRWCKRCTLVAQIDYMRPLVSRLAECERELTVIDQQNARREELEVLRTQLQTCTSSVSLLHLDIVFTYIESRLGVLR